MTNLSKPTVSPPGSPRPTTPAKVSCGGVVGRVWVFYRDGFRSMTVGRTLWLLIAIKFFIMFAVLKLFFFPSFLGKFARGEERDDYVRRQLIERKQP